MLKTFGVELIFLGFIFFLLISGADFFKSQVLNPDYLFSKGTVVAQDVVDGLFNTQVYNLYKNFLIFLALFFITIICYCAVRMLEIRKKEHDHHHHEMHEYAKRQKEREKKSAAGSVSASQNPRWNQTLTYLMSDSSSDWKLAIIEADSMLESLLADLGFKGDSLGDRLKMASKDTFNGLSTAWEVHAIRNKIAHEGLAFELSHHEAKRVIAQYEQIFRNYGFI